MTFAALKTVKIVLMKNSMLFFLLLLPFALFAQVGIGTNTPEASAKLEVKSTNKGFLPPRVALTGTTDTSTISSPASGLLIYNTATAGSSPTNVIPGYYFYNGTSWSKLNSATDNAANVTGTVAVANGGTGTTTGAITGTTALTFAAGGTNQNVTLTPSGTGKTILNGNVGIGTSTPSTSLEVGNAAGTSSGEIVINPQTNSSEGGQITLKKSVSGSGTDWIIDQYGTTSSDARLRIFNSIAETNGITIMENGNIGMGSLTPSVRLQVNGDIIANSIAGSSDLRYKTNIRPVYNALDKVKALRGVYFNWNIEAFPDKNFGTKDELGFIAQEIENVVPEIVTKDNTKEEYRSVKYDKLVTLLVEAIKEQQIQIDSLKIQLNKKKDKK
jgi:hypothetical protein